jgi:hypothetical protein
MIMRTTVLSASRIRQHLLRTLHLFYAGLFAFVLPLICWGAQATPGHPHARAHFVFVEPLLSGHTDSNTTANAVLSHSAMGHHGEHDLDHAASHSHQQPVGRATPSMAGFTMLTLVGRDAVALPFNADGPGFCCWFIPPDALSFIALISTPPPR